MDTGLVVLFVLFYAGGAASLYIVLRAELLRNKAWVHWTAVIYFVCTAAPLGVKVLGRGGLAGPLMQVIAVGPGCLMYVPLLAFMVANTFISAGRRAMGDHRLVVSKTYDQAEAAEKRRDYERAMSLYRQAAAADPADLEARRRIGELCLVIGNVDEGIGELRTVFDGIKDTEKRATIGFRVADLLVSLKRDRAAARMILEEIVKSAEGTRFAQLAHERMRRIS